MTPITPTAAFAKRHVKQHDADATIDREHQEHEREVREQLAREDRPPCAGIEQQLL